MGEGGIPWPAGFRIRREESRTPFVYVFAKVAAMRTGGVRAGLVEFGGADHFLFFRRGDAVPPQIETWVAE